MTRVLVATLMMACITSLSADERPVRIAFADEPAADRSEPSDERLAPLVDPQAAGTYDVAFVLPDKPPAPARAYHPMCDCGYTIGNLDCWCDTCTPCTTTDQWCDHGCHEALGSSRLLSDGTWVSDDLFCDVSGPPSSCYEHAVRFGWWGVSASGSPTRVGEYQSLRSSPFFDVDTLVSDGERTLDLMLSGLDDEANDAHGRYYGPKMSADVRFQRFLRRWDHDPMMAPSTANAGPAPPAINPRDVISDDLNVGEDYAIRVQQLDARFKGRISDNVSWKLNVWGMRKFGERQANSVGHCFDLNPAPGNQDNRCHVLSQRQRIDWVTMEVQPVVEARFDSVTVEFSHTVRSFGQDDDVTNRQFSRFGYSPASGSYGSPFIHNFVPDNTTHIDRLKVVADLTDCNQFYANLYIGQTENHFRDTHRQFGGFDLRLTNRSIDGVTLTTYGSMYDENNQLPRTFFNTSPLGLGETAANVDHPVDYNRQRVGVKSDWRPFDDSDNCDPSYWNQWSTLRIVSSYEYYVISRDFATYSSARLGNFSQPDTKIHQFEFGPNLKWTPETDSYVRYKVKFAEDPIIGVREFQGRFNTNQPEQEHRIDLGGTWMPSTNFMANAQFSLVSRWNDSLYPSRPPAVTAPIRFTEHDYPFVGTLWYAPTERLSLTGAYAYSSNYIDQDITVGFRGPDFPGSPFETVPWNYQGENHLISLSGTYAWSPCVNLLAGAEWNRGINSFDVPPMVDPTIPAGVPNWSQLPGFSYVRVETLRLTAGADWQPYDHITLYTRYVYFDWDDLSQGTYTGLAHMVLAGASVVW